MARRASLLDEVRGLLSRAAEVYRDPAQGPMTQPERAGLDEPLRVAIAGKVKAGKSTLLNALVGEELAPTDAGECTKIVTWYRDGITYRVTLHPSDGSEPRQVPFSRDAGAIDLDLGDLPAEVVDRLVVDWPAAALRPVNLVGPPGL